MSVRGPLSTLQRLSGVAAATLTAGLDSRLRVRGADVLYRAVTRAPPP